jgi:hypothetical protein
LLQNEVMIKIEQFKTLAETSLDRFQKKYHERIILILFPSSTEADFFKTKNALMRPLADNKIEYSVADTMRSKSVKFNQR